jgi:hypothetical protein
VGRRYLLSRQGPDNPSMRFTTLVVVGWVALTSLSCRPKGFEVPSPAEQAPIRDQLAEFARSWLFPAKIAPPNVAFEAHEATDGAITVTVEPLRPEDASWNAWPGPSSRLFNNRAALLFEVTVVSTGPVRWIPDNTGLELNDPGHPLPPARTADELLAPLLRAALFQERYALDGDYVQRTRAAGPFRSAYLPLDAADSPLHGVIGFPLPDPEEQVIALRVTVGVQGKDGPHAVKFLYE